MKKLILLLALFPSLLYAQSFFKNDPGKRKNTSFLLHTSSRNEPVLRVGKTLPDSTYIYTDQAQRNVIDQFAITYDSEGRKKQLKGLEVIENGQFIEYQENYSYQLADGKLKEEIVYSSLEKGKWIDEQKVVIIYNTNHFSVEIYEYNYDHSGKKWDLKVQIIATEFNQKGNPLVMVSSEMVKGKMIETLLERIEYNNQDLHTGSLFYENKASAGTDWGNEGKEEYTYNEDLNLQFIKIYELGSGGFQLSAVVEMKYDTHGNLASEISKSGNEVVRSYYFKNVYLNSVGISEISAESQYQIYPNPATDYVTVSLGETAQAQVTILSVSGAVMYTQNQTQATATIPLQGLAKGVYFVKIENGVKKETHKLVIR